MKPFALVLALFTLAACGPQTFVIQSYDGPVRERETIAILRINSSDQVRVVTVDGEYADPKLADDTRLHIELLPGKHEVAAQAEPSASSAEAAPLLRRLSFQAEAGRVYRVAFVRGGPEPIAAPSGEPRVFEVDRGSDGPLRDVTLARPERPEPKPLPVLVPAPVLAPEPAEPALVPPSDTSSTPPPPDPSVPPMP